MAQFGSLGRQGRRQARMVMRFADWLFANPEGPRSPVRVVAWWEARRLAFNVIIGVYGFISLGIFFWALATSGQLQPGEDAVEPIALFGALFGINILYTLGSLVEIPARIFAPGLSHRFGPLLLKSGLGLGLLLITLPAAFWLGYRLLQLVGIA